MTGCDQPKPPGRGLLVGLLLLLIFGFVARAPAANQESASSLRFVGNESIPTARLIGHLQRLRVKAEGRLTPMQVDDAAFFIGQFYQAQGYWEAEVTYIYDPGRGSATLEIREGPEVLLGEIEFTGASVISTDRLRDIVRSTARRASGRLFGHLRFVPFALDEAAQSIVQAYADRGHLGAVVSWEPVEDSMGQRGAHFHLEEGPLFLVRTISVEGVTSGDLPPDFFSTHLDHPYTPDEDFLLRAKLLARLKNQGHYTATGTVTREIDESDGSVHLHFQMEPGPVFHLGAVRVVGTQRTNPAALRGLLGLRPGQAYDGERKRKGLRRVWFTGAFANAEVHLQPSPDAPETLDVEIEVEEARARQFLFSLGYSQWYQAFGEFEYTDRNIFGSLTRLTIRGGASMKSHSAQIYWSNPFVLNTENTASVGAYYFRQELPGYRITAAGGILGIERLLNPPTLSGYQLQLLYRAILDATVFGLGPDEEQPSRYTVSALNWLQVWDRRNDPLVPMSGWLAGYELFLATETLGGDLNYFKPSFQLSWYYPFREITPERRFVPFFLINHRAGAILPFAGTGVVPTPERFFLGGPTTVRSFQLDGMAPRDEDGDPLGGQLFWLLNVEAQIPIWSALYGVAFVDFGNLAPSWEEATVNQTRVAPGLGLRFYTPIGAVFVDYGYNLVRLDGDPVGAVQFGFGFTF